MPLILAKDIAPDAAQYVKDAARLKQEQIADGARFILTGYSPLDAGIVVHMVCPNPGPGQESNHDVTLTREELAACASSGDALALVQTKLTARHRTSESLLDAVIGKEIVL